MLLNSSSIVEQCLQFMQQNQDIKFSASNIFFVNNPNIDFSPQFRSLYESWLNQQVSKKNLMVFVSNYDPFGTKFYYLESWQKDYWQSHNWQV